MNELIERDGRQAIVKYACELRKAGWSEEGIIKFIKEVLQ